MNHTDFETGWNDTHGKRAPTLAHQAALELREQILNGCLAPDQALPLAETADHLEMSIMPVREALRRLEFEGLVKQVPQRGARVSSLIPEDVEDVYHARITMESRAVIKAAANFNERDYSMLSAVLHEYHAAYEAGDEGRGRRQHEQFHFGLYALSQSTWIVRLIRVLWDTSERYRRLSVAHRGSLGERVKEHSEILEACREGRKEKAGQLMASHLTRTFEIVKSDVDKHLASQAMKGSLSKE